MRSFWNASLRILSFLVLLSHATNVCAEQSLEFVRRVGSDRIILVENLEKSDLALEAQQKSNGSAEEIAKAFLTELFSRDGGFQGLSDVENDLELQGVQTDQFGLKHIRYRQLYKGEVPVYGTELVVRLRLDKSVNTVSVFTIPKLSPLTTSALSLQEAERIAKSHFRKNELYRNGVKRRQIKNNCKKRSPDIHVIRRSRCFRIRLRRRKKIFKPVQLKESELYVYSERFLNQKAENDQRFVWEIALGNAKGFQQERYLIDAATGEVVLVDRGIRGLNRLVYDASRTNTALDLDVPQNYGSPTPYFHGRSESVHTPRGPLPIQGPMSGSTDVDDYYGALGELNRYYSQVLSRNGANNLGGLVTGSAFVENGDTAIYTHIDNNIALGQECQNKHSFSGANYIAFCSEASASQHDSLGHEYAHFLARNMGTSPGYPVARELSETGESGAILEAIADFYGEAFERFQSDDGTNDWVISSTAGNGFERHLSDPSSSIGSAANDTIDVYPEHYGDRNFYCGQAGDRTGVHANSLVMSKAFHLMSEGTGESTYNGCSVEGIGFQKVEFLIYYALVTEFHPYTSLNESYTLISKSCDNLKGLGYLGFTQADCEKVLVAMQAVQIDQPGYCATLDDSRRATCAHIEEPVVVPGDYDRDLDVDYDDYVTWTQADGSNVAPGSGADGNGDGKVDDADHLIWKLNVGRGIETLYSGDYNRDGMVDDADYKLWRSMYGATPAEAGLGADGNKDGRIDAADYSVWRDNLGAGVPETLTGDYDQDGDVDEDDYAKWRSCYGAVAAGSCKYADGNGDGRIDAADYSVWRDNLGSTLNS